ncbi:serine hydrolase domain-containing protein [Sphingobacterium spiritivorum]|uniref:serine hydrolase domain-containing protein n=1 Tax=Sphingobacterium spiritivorum TaxID=258 RepID=UPI003DA3916C
MKDLKNSNTATYMWQYARIVLVLLIILVKNTASYAQTDSSVFNNKKLVEKWIKDNKVPVLGLGIIENGVLQQATVYGDLKEGVVAPKNTIFNVASLTKPVTAIVALKLVSQGKWDLDEPLYTYWTDPDIAHDPRNKKLTTRHVLSHQTGFPNWRWENENEKLGFQFDPGTKYQYSGEGFEYLRKALEKKFRKSLQQLADGLVFKPVKMSDTQYIWNKSLDSTRLSPGYNEKGESYPVVKNTTPNAADDLMTTIEDYGKFMISVMNGEGLTKKVFDEMISRQVSTTRGKHFGLGFEIYDFKDSTYALSHGGSDKGVRTIVFMLPEIKQGILIFTNSDNGVNLYVDLLQYYLKEKGREIVDIETKNTL